MYDQVLEGTRAPTNKEATSTRNTPPRRAKITEPGPKKPRYDEREPLIKKICGLLVKCRPTDKRISADESLGLKVICCKCAFSRDSTCTLSYCETCMELMLGPEEDNQGEGGTRHGGGGGKDDRVGTVVKCCDKGECGRHTEADLEDLETPNIDKSYLKATAGRRRKKWDGRMWQNTAEGVDDYVFCVT